MSRLSDLARFGTALPSAVTAAARGRCCRLCPAAAAAAAAENSAPAAILSKEGSEEKARARAVRHKGNLVGFFDLCHSISVDYLCESMEVRRCGTETRKNSLLMVEKYV